MRPTRRSHPAAAAARHQKAELLRTLRVICVNLRALQTSPETAAIYRDVEDFLAREIARLHPGAAGRTRARRPRLAPPTT